ncbi:MAG: DUF1467 family protein [Alphaproteobacteria bacterium]|nr:DUF1467 family protein [Alphaproteobacteria bacterium]
MTWSTGLFVFVIIWWLVLFTVLPWGVRQPEPEEIEPGEMAGAPRRSRLVLKLVVTTGIAVILWIGAYFLITSDLISFRETAS